MPKNPPPAPAAATLTVTVIGHRIVTAEVPPGLPPASCDDAWMCVNGGVTDHAHLFPAGGDRSLCGHHLRADAGGRATACPVETRGRVTVANPNYRPYCPTCQAVQEHRWLHAYPRRGEGNGAA